MIQYTFSSEHPNSHYIDIELIVKDCRGETLELQLPSWRPGRYELGNFAKNIKKFSCYDKDGHPLNFSKVNKDLWVISTEGNSMIKINYSYFASELNAGSTFVDDTQMYVNPVNCCMYVPDRMHEEHSIKLKVPENYKVVGSLLKSSPFTLQATNFEELADSPFICSEKIQSINFKVKTIDIHLHFTGECRPDNERLLQDFRKFIDISLEFFESSPINEFHFLFQILPYKFYHGVEHLRSTVIAIGPGYHLMHGSTYEDVLGVSCHELFHLWNIKTIRPTEMLPYDYTKENYSRLGFVYEGFTTYYGDLLLYQSNVFSQEQYFKTLEERINKHLHNFGRFNLSLANSSFDTWLDGYVPGAPYRKVSIYDEGNLFAFILDVNILEKTNGKRSLREVCLELYRRAINKEKGYCETDIIALVNEISGSDLSDLFNKFCYDTTDYFSEISRCMTLLDFELNLNFSNNLHESILGIKLTDGTHGKKIINIAPGSPAFTSGLCIGDEIISVNHKGCKLDAKEWFNYYLESEKKIELGIIRQNETRNIKISCGEKMYFPYATILDKKTNKTDKENLLLRGWEGFTWRNNK